ncbi:MAG: hypothetical protein IPK39_04185 [Sulfuritalea sp.]|nr:hypothetical protein [Sulfuritalea sp.]
MILLVLGFLFSLVVLPRSSRLGLAPWSYVVEDAEAASGNAGAGTSRPDN